MKIVSHAITTSLDLSPVPVHEITIQFTYDTICELREIFARSSGLDFRSEFIHVFGEEFMDEIIIPLTEGKHLT